MCGVPHFKFGPAWVASSESEPDLIRACEVDDTCGSCHPTAWGRVGRLLRRLVAASCQRQETGLRCKSTQIELVGWCSPLRAATGFMHCQHPPRGPGCSLCIRIESFLRTPVSCPLAFIHQSILKLSTPEQRAGVPRTLVTYPLIVPFISILFTRTAVDLVRAILNLPNHQLIGRHPGASAPPFGKNQSGGSSWLACSVARSSRCIAIHCPAVGSLKLNFSS